LDYLQPEPARPGNSVAALAAAKPHSPAEAHTAKVAVQPALTGGLTVEGFRLSGGGLSQPLEAAKIEIAPTTGPDLRSALTGEASFPLGGTTPLAINLRMGLWGYAVTARGTAAIGRGRELAHAAGLPSSALLDELAGDALGVDLTAAGPWMAPEKDDSTPAPVANVASARVASLNAAMPANVAVPAAAAATSNAAPVDDSLRGTVQLRNANWKADYLVNHVQIAQATLHFEDGAMRWDPVAFSYGPLKGTASLLLPVCHGNEVCRPRFEMQFGAVDAATLQAALLGAHTRGTMISELITRLHPEKAALWPVIEGVVRADALAVGPVTLKKATATLTMNAAGVEIAALEADVLGGRLHLAGAVKAGDKPEYDLTGTAEKLSPAAVGQLVGSHWTGGELSLSGKLQAAGYTADDLAGSAKGTLHLDWKHGAVGGVGAPAALARFASWTAEAGIGAGRIALGQNEVADGASKGAARSSVEGSIPLSLPGRIGFAAAKTGKASR
jgi:hypothetical protein